MLRLEQEEVPQRKESKKDSDKADEAEADIKLESQDTTMKKVKRRKSSSGQKSGSRQPQTCSVCAAVLSSRGALTKHMVIHQVVIFQDCMWIKRNIDHVQEKKPFQCQECSQSFNQARDLKTHTMQRHSSERPHVCGICGKGFVHKSYLMEHMSYHTGERQYQCYHCGNRFQAQSALVKHMKRHTASKDFVCNNCPKAFAVKTDLKSHIRLVHEKPQVSCTIKPTPTENAIESSTEKRAEDHSGADVAMDDADPVPEQEAGQVNGVPFEKDPLPIKSNIRKEDKETDCKDVKNLIKCVRANEDENIRELTEIERNNIVNTTSAASDKAEPKSIEVEHVLTPKVAVDEQIPSLSISTNRSDKAKEITPYIPNVPKV